MRSAVRGMIIAYTVYLACSLLILLPALNILPHRFLQDQYGRQLNSELILFNPFTLALQVRNAALSEPDGEPFLAFSYAEMNLSLASVIQTSLVLDKVALQDLSIHLRRKKDGQLNIADFLPADRADSNDEPDAPPPGITIADLSISARRIDFTDNSHPQDYSTHINDFSLAVTNLSTVKEAGQPYRLSASTEGGGHLLWEAEVSLPASQSSGRLQLTNIDLRPAWRFARPWVTFALARGQLDMELDYTLDWSEALHYTLAGGALGIRDLSLTPNQDAQLPDTGIALQALNLAGLNVDSAPQTATLDALKIRGLDVSGWSEGSRVSLTEMLLPPPSEAEADSAPEPATEPAEFDWSLQLKLAKIEQSAVHWRSEFTEPALLQVTPLTGELRDVRWPAKEPSAFSLSLAINDAAKFDLAGALHAGTGEGDVAFALESLPLAWFAPNLPAVLRAEIGSGEARTAGTVRLESFLPQTVNADGAVIDFSMRLRGADDALTRWDSVSWTGLDVQPLARSVNLSEMHIEGYQGRLHIQEDGQLNVQRLLAQEAATETPQAPPSEEPEQPADTTQEAPWTLELPAIFVANSTVDFLDESLPIRFRTVVGDLDGTITDLSSRKGQPLAVDLKGSVDGYAPVTLSGTASPLQDPPSLDLRLRFRGLDMARLTPYSGTYAGYAIEDGVMTVDLRYGLANNRLQGNNQIVIDQLQLGERIESSKALDLPLRLGIALLTDSNGVIDLAVPVSGDVNNPQFSLGSVIAGAFVNLLTKAITAPFALLANLVGSSEDLDTVDFAAGSSELDDHGQGKLRDLATAMQQRPELSLQISGRLELDSDRTQLQRQLARSALLDAGLSEQDIRDRTRAWEDVVTNLYAEVPAPEPTDADAEGPSVLQQARILRDQWPVPDEALTALATQRATTTKDFLLNAGIPAERLEVTASEAESTEKRFSGVALAITVD
ncbi:MAG: DUF748 domain-containing protein [Halieaceae bacterium]|uniref:DUF748 domain-containing protein n=1 Tax=Haliea alexandrii TaxID=2448162 RepID=UPI001304E8A9|nr:DUF748 domain-containing protein [Haliea alexandrii]MCR9186568.1 DUF748 domain-containing protein [Halieaceae bacterium]